ncbi:MAG TPA: hypothetical protein VFE51_15640 [Verrucomicrobiae bacterium]|nr:hypothetical protein [Verrucomicrobiae bacterium]
MDDLHDKRLTDEELKEFFDRLFPRGFAGADVMQEIAPEGWEKSSLFVCFHPSPQQVLNERRKQHRHLEKLRRDFPQRKAGDPKPELRPEPTMEQVLADWKEIPINITEEVTELVGLCLWDVFSDNHEVIASDRRIVDIGSFRGASAFLDECIAGPVDECYFSGEFRFYMGSIWISRRTDLTPVYRMIFRRLKSLGADWNYHFPRVYLVDLSPLRQAMANQEGPYSPSEAFAKEQEERQSQAELEEARARLDKIHNQACSEAMDRPPPEIVRAYQEVYGRDPNGWPP